MASEFDLVKEKYTGRDLNPCGIGVLISCRASTLDKIGNGSGLKAL